jgi:hypothetical protein
MSDVMRLVPKHDVDIFFVMAFLLSATGQALLRRGRTGTNVDHLSPKDVTGIPIPWFTNDRRTHYSTSLRRAEELLARGQQTLDALDEELSSRLNVPKATNADGVEASTVFSSAIRSRLDAAYYGPPVDAARRHLRGRSRLLSEAADLVMLGRYKRYYVDSANGRPVLSGRQMLQLRPVNLQYISDRSFDDPGSFVIRRGWTLFTCDGRSEEALGAPAYVTTRWDGWMASNHVMRAVPKDVHPGFLFLAINHFLTQIQLKRSATGSVIDALDPASTQGVLIPSLEPRSEEAMGSQVVDAWEAIATSMQITEAMTVKFESELVEHYETWCSNGTIA